MLVTGLLLTDMPVKALAAQDEGISGTAGKYEVSSDILTMQNDYTSIHMSGVNGGFYISNVEGDKLVKSDNNKDLLYHNDEYDTSFTSFKITKNNVTNTYIFGGDYSFEGIETSPVTVLKDAKGLAARWTLGELEFTQRLEPANSGSNEHGMVCISYDVVNNGSEDVQIEARMLLDSAAGNQDYMYYDILESSYQSDIIQKECIIKSDKIPTAFYAYDDMYNPSVVANHVISSKGMLKQIAFAHWNSLAATDFDFAPDESYNFTYEGGGEYRTADSAMAMYYDLGTISAGKQGLVNTYYGVFSNESVNPDVDTVAFNMTAPATLDLSADKKNYISNCNQNEDGSYKEDGIINIQASLKNVSNDIDYKNIAVSVYASEGITPLDKHQKPLDYETSYIRPYSCQFVDFTKGTNINIPFYFKVGVDTSASYRKITFRVYNIPEDSDSNLLFENMLYEGSTYILCPGGQGKLPAITFNSATPQVMYSEFSRHLYITGKNFSMLEDKSRYTLYAQLDENTRYEIPAENITVYPEENKLDVLFNKKMAAGNYKLIFDWIDPPLGVDKKLTGEALNIAMSDDVRYRNDYYGVLAVVQGSGTSNSNAKYNIETFANEEAFQKKKDEYEEVLLVFKGDFVKDDTFDAGKNGDNVRYVAKSVQGDSDKIIINGCIDALKGTVTVSKKDGKINTDFDDITLNASVENTRIYKGNAGLTSIQDGKEYSLVPYNTNGEELKGFDDNVITLIYPTALNGLMTIAGMAFSLSFARLGMMYETKANSVNNLSKDQARGYVMSFSAGLDLGFLIPKSKRNTVTDEPAEDTDGGIFADIGAKADKLRERYDKMIKSNGPISDLFIDNNKNSSEEDDEGKGDIKTKAAVQVDNILYGMNQGFIGVNFKVDVAVPGYTEAMPNIEGTLEVNTVNDWSFGVEGKLSFIMNMKLEVKLGFKSKNNIPIVDNMSFFVQGIKPGINIDGLGVCWILGGGGGFENLYDTIFCTSEVPPLRLLLSVSFSLFQALEARADMSLGLTGFSVKVSDLKVSQTDIVVLDYGSLYVDWIPSFRALMQIQLNVLGVVEGKGYIVIDNSDGAEEAFEAYAIACVKIPDSVPLIGGIEVGSASIGLNTTRIWGALQVLGFSTGVSYVYGGDFSFGSEANVSPTYPQYLEEDGGAINYNGRTWYAVGYDSKKQDMLYMSVNSNVYQTAASESNASKTALTTSLSSDITKTSHEFTLGRFEDGGAQVLSVAYSADTIEKAKNIRDRFVILDDNGNPVTLKYYDNEASEAENETANANFTYNDEKKEGTIVVSFTDNVWYNRTYKVQTATSSELILYAVDPLPEVTGVSVTGSSYTNTDNEVTVNWSGNAKMTELEKMDIYVVESTDAEADGGTPVATLTKSDIAKKTATIKLPDSLKSGKYYIRAVYSKEDVTAGIINTEAAFDYSNDAQPDSIAGVSVANAGDLQIKAQVDAAADDKCAGALFKLYEVNDEGEKTELTEYGVTAIKNDAKELYAVLGGSSDNSSTDEDGNTVTKKEGLKANSKYIISATPFNTLEDSEGNITNLVYGEEAFSDELILNEPEKATITLTADKKKYQVGRIEHVKDENDNVEEKTVMYDTYDSSTINFTATSDMNVSGTWVFDGEEVKSGEFEDTRSIPINLSGIADGDHTITIQGSNAEGDGFMETFVFNVDTTAPTLLLTSPVNGSGFNEDGQLTISGITEDDAYITVNVDGNPILRSKTLNDINAVMGQEGDFSFDVNIGKSYYRKNIEVIVSDEIGNIQTTQCDVYNNGLGNVKELDLSLSADTTDNTEKEWVSYSGRNLFLNDSGDTSVALQLCAITNDNNTIILNDMENVEWNVGSVIGSAVVDDNKLTIKEDSHGFVEGKLVLADGAALSESFTYGAEVQGEEEESGLKLLYDANGGEGAMTDPNSPYSKNDSVLLAECGFTSTGKKFVEWNTKADGSGISYIPGDRFYIKDNITLYAIWEKSEPEPTEAPTEEPTSTPEATKVPTEEPTATPKATKAPTEEPTATPKATTAPTEVPASRPEPTKAPTEEPAATPKLTKEPTQAPPVENPAIGSTGNSGENNTVLPGSTHIIGKAKFKVTSAKTVTYIATTDKKAKKLTIPDKVMINGQSYNVTAVGANVCKNSKKLTAVVLGKNVVVIEAKAFYNYKKLKNIKFTSTKISGIGKNAFKGINKKAVFKVPKKAKKKYKSKLNKKVGFVKKTMVIK